ncbi:MAG: NMD3-related protein [Candidatus Micrarchaeota archaeon]
MHNIICPKCGATSDKVQFIGPFCIKCSPIRIECPKEFSIDVCAKCGRMRLARDWVPITDTLLNRLFSRKCRGDFKKVEFDPSGTATFFIEKEGNIFPLQRHFKFIQNKIMCPDCSRKGSGYFEAIIQLRGSPERIAKYEKLLTSGLSKTTFIAKTEDLKEGKDIYAGSTKSVLELFHGLGLRTLITRKLSGQKQGKRLYRTTFLLRL